MHGNRTRRFLRAHPEITAMAALAAGLAGVWAVGTGGRWLTGQVDIPTWFRVVWFCGVAFAGVRLVVWCMDGGPGQMDALHNAERARSIQHLPPEEWSIWDDPQDTPPSERIHDAR